jgi:hypothetical protein
MNKEDVIEYYGSVPKVAEVLDVTPFAVWKWKKVPELRQYELEVKSAGALKSEFTLNRLNKDKE